MRAFESMRANLIAELGDADGGRMMAMAVRNLPAICDDGGPDAWLRALDGEADCLGLIPAARRRLERSGGRWKSAVALLVGLRQTIVELDEPTKHSCPFGCVSGCAVCDGRGAVFAQRAA